ncbi:MAG: hypothetical protein IGS48_12960 [Oscillatoriales cyanobacterium C42_A2020_001]|nr:hypothetical protein [Leptolyngbyaceae cyanobacterium C42_A2020_001]
MPKEPSKSDFALAIEQAIADPISADLRSLLNELEQALLGLSQEMQLRVAGMFLGQLAEIYAARAAHLLDSWEVKYNPIQSEPVITAEMLQEVLRHTMTLNLDGVLDVPEPYPCDSLAGNSMVGAVSETNLLEFLNQIDQERAKRHTFDVAHDEDVSAWVSKISQWMHHQPHSPISLIELQRSLKMPLIEIWLALLLGGYVIEQRGDFYQLDGIWISQ